MDHFTIPTPITPEPMGWMDILEAGWYATGFLSAVAIGMATWHFIRARPYPTIIHLQAQSATSESLQNDDGIAVHRSLMSDDLVSFLYPEAQTLYEAFQRGARLSGDRPCYGWRIASDKPYSWITYDEFLVRVQNFGSGLIHNGLRPGSEHDTIVGIFSINRLEWVIAEQAAYMFSYIVVPLYDTLGAEACSFIINQVNMKTVVCDSEEKVLQLLRDAEKTPSLKQIVLTRPLTDELADLGTASNIQIFTFFQCEALGARDLQTPSPPNPEDLATICYTSGTTGHPKGVMLTHRNVIAASAGTQYHLCVLPQTDIMGRSDEVQISYLPLAHMLERVVQVSVYINGGRIGFYQGDVRLLMDDIKVLRPTVFPTVPRLLNRIYSKVNQSAGTNFFKKGLFSLAVRMKTRELNRGVIRSDGMWDPFFAQVRESMGGRLRLVVTGSAPISRTVLTFCRCVFGCPVLEGYGQTECTAPATLTIPGDNKPGHVGPPLPCTEIKLVDVPDMGYYAANNRGEVCLRGTNVSSGYYKDEEKTRETMDSNGWVHTGDVGEWTEEGTLKIIDRKKHIFKLSQGEYIAPEKVERAYNKSHFVAQVYIHGDSLKSCVVAVIVPEMQAVKKWSKDQNLNGKPFEEICQLPEFKEVVMKDITAQGKQSGLKSFEQAKAIHLHPDLFSVENGLLTPTFKAKRSALEQKFKIVTTKLYENLD